MGSPSSFHFSFTSSCPHPQLSLHHTLKRKPHPQSVASNQPFKTATLISLPRGTAQSSCMPCLTPLGLLADPHHPITASPPAHPSVSYTHSSALHFPSAQHSTAQHSPALQHLSAAAAAPAAASLLLLLHSHGRSHPHLAGCLSGLCHKHPQPLPRLRAADLLQGPAEHRGFPEGRRQEGRRGTCSLCGHVPGCCW